MVTIPLKGWNISNIWEQLNSIHEEIKSTLKSGMLANLLSSILLYKNIKIKINRTIILPVVLYGCEIWSVTMSNTK
jgi:hypothetical protein